MYHMHFSKFKVLLWQNCIFQLKAILKHMQVVSARRKMLFTIFNFIPEIFFLLNMQISQVMKSFTKTNFDQKW